MEPTSQPSSAQSATPAGGTYQPVGVPAVAPKNPGMIQGVISIICAVVSLLLFPPFFGIAGIILGVLATRKGEKALGITGIVLSSVFMLIGIAFGVYVSMHPGLLKTNNSSTSGAVIESVMQ